MGYKTTPTFATMKKSRKTLDKQIKSSEMLVCPIQNGKYIYFHFGLISG
jgi:hypothetical protein